jgi:hypothetical protein
LHAQRCCKDKIQKRGLNMDVAIRQLNAGELELVSGGGVWGTVAGNLGKAIMAGGSSWAGAQIGAEIGCIGGPAGALIGGLIGLAAGTILTSDWSLFSVATQSNDVTKQTNEVTMTTSLASVAVLPRALDASELDLVAGGGKGASFGGMSDFLSVRELRSRLRYSRAIPDPSLLTNWSAPLLVW